MLKKLLLCVLGLAMSVSMAFAAVNINTASEKELESLPGVGPVKAKAIADYRKKNGDFKSLDDVKKVDGIGDKTFADIKGQIAISGATTPVAAAKAKDEKPKEEKKAAKEEKPRSKRR